MSREKQIEEMAKVIAIPCYKRIEVYGDGSKECPSPLPCNECTAELLYNAGYRKQSEGKWTNIAEDGFPKEEGEYFVWNAEQRKREIRFFFRLPPNLPVETNPEVREYFGNSADHKKITHWMPLPEPPKGE